MGFIGSVQNWYQRHRTVRALSTAAKGVALLSAADAAAEYFFDRPVVSTVAHAAGQHALDISGDLRTIGSYVENTAGSDKRTVESRARVNLGYSPLDGFDVWARGVAEYSSHPPFDYERFGDDHDEVYVDRAFADIDLGDGVGLKLGGFDNTYTGWFERDCIPNTGIQAEYTREGMMSMDKVGVKATFNAGSWLDESDSKFIGFELEGEKSLIGGWKVSGSANYMQWFGLDGEYVWTNRNEGGGYASDFKVLNAKIGLENGSEDLPLSVFVIGIHNFGADRDNDGYILGAGFGDLEEPGDSRFSFQYRNIEADATLASSTPKATPMTGFKAPVFFFDYKISDNLTLSLAYAMPADLHGRKRGDWNFGSASLQYGF